MPEKKLEGYVEGAKKVWTNIGKKDGCCDGPVCGEGYEFDPDQEDPNPIPVPGGNS